jgi:hypothetical protein
MVPLSSLNSTRPIAAFEMLDDSPPFVKLLSLVMTPGEGPEATIPGSMIGFREAAAVMCRNYR